MLVRSFIAMDNYFKLTNYNCFNYKVISYVINLLFIFKVSCKFKALYSFDSARFLFFVKSISESNLGNEIAFMHASCVIIMFEII